MGKPSPPDPPNYAPMAEASAEAARISGRLGKAQLKFSKRQHDDMKRLAVPVVRQQMDIAGQQHDMAREYYDYQKGTFWPAEQALMQQAQDFNSDAYREQLAQKAAADAGAAFSATMGATDRHMASMGVNPNSGAWGTQANTNALGLAAARTNAMNQTSQAAEQLGWARQMDAVGLGRGLAGASQGAYSGAIAAGNSAMGNASAPGQTHMQGMAMGGGTIMQGQGMQMTGLGNILNAQTSVYGNQLQANAAQTAGLYNAIGSGLGFAAGGWSDRRLKTDIIAVGEYDNGLTMYEFAYRDHPDVRYRGVMADEVEKVFPEAVITDPEGYKRVRYDVLGIGMEVV